MDIIAARVKLQGKSLGLGVFLAIFFGGLGMFYLSIWWGLIGLFMQAVLVLISVLTGGFLAFLLVGWHILCVIITVVSINNHNRRLLDSLA